jgi:hypothetical protein
MHQLSSTCWINSLGKQNTEKFMYIFEINKDKNKNIKKFIRFEVK